MRLFSCLLLSLIICSCSSKKEISQKDMVVRLTVYWKNEDGWTKKGFTSTGGPLISYKTVAVDPKVFPYGSKIQLPELGLDTIALDTGSAVKSRKASRKMGRNNPVIDLYIEKKKDALAFIKNKPYFTTARIIP